MAGRGLQRQDDEQWTLRYIPAPPSSKSALTGTGTGTATTAAADTNDAAGTRTIPIVTQDANGPCSLVALSNILLLRGLLTITPPDRPVVDFAYLSSKIAQLLLDPEREPQASQPVVVGAAGKDASARADGDGAEAVDRRALLSQALDVLPETRRGLHVDVDFRAHDAFHPPDAPQLALFRLFGIRLVHGWLPDPADAETYAALVPSRGGQRGEGGDDADGREEEPWRLGSDYDAVVQRLVSAQDIAGNYVDLDVRVDGHSARHPEAKVAGAGAGAGAGDPGRTQAAAGAVDEQGKDMVDALVTPLGDLSTTSTWAPTPADASSQHPEPRSRSQQATAQPTFPIASSAPAAPPESWTPAQADVVSAATRIRSFLESNPTQLTVHGLFTLAARLAPGELCAWFRNEHLAVLYRRREEEEEGHRGEGGEVLGPVHGRGGGPVMTGAGADAQAGGDAPGQGTILPSTSTPAPTHERARDEDHTPFLFTLVTDALLAHEHPDMVWESLEDVHGGAGAFYDYRFRRVEVRREAAAGGGGGRRTARLRCEEVGERGEGDATTTTSLGPARPTRGPAALSAAAPPARPYRGAAEAETDYALAYQLQQEEDHRAAAAVAEREERREWEERRQPTPTQMQPDVSQPERARMGAAEGGGTACGDEGGGASSGATGGGGGVEESGRADDTRGHGRAGAKSGRRSGGSGRGERCTIV